MCSWLDNQAPVYRTGHLISTGHLKPDEHNLIHHYKRLFTKHDIFKIYRIIPLDPVHIIYCDAVH